MLNNQRTALLEFLDSEGYAVAKKGNDDTYKAAIEVLLDTEVNDIGDIVKILEARVEARVRRDFHQQFVLTLEALDDQLKELDNPNPDEYEHSSDN